MAKKAKTFAEKAMKKSLHEVCSVCGQEYSAVKLVKSEKKGTSNNWQYVEKIVKVCKCNEKEVYS